MIEWNNYRLRFGLIVAVLLISVLVYLLWSIAFPFLLGALLAYLLNPVIYFLQYEFSLPRSVCIAILFLFFLIIGIYFSSMFVQLFSYLSFVGVSEIMSASVTILEDLFNNADETLGHNFLTFEYDEFVRWISNYFDEMIRNYVLNLGNIFQRLINHFFVFLVLTPIATYYFLKDKDFMFQLIKTNTPTHWWKELQPIFDRISEQIGQYIRSQVFVAAIVFVSVLLFMSLFNEMENYAFLFSIVASITSFIPYLGAILGALLPVLLSIYFYGLGFNFTIISLFFLILHTILGFVFIPKILSSKVHIHPLTTFFVLSMGHLFFGIVGMLICVPLFIVAKTLFRSIWMPIN